VPNAVEDGHVHDDDFSYTVRLAYDIGDNVNIYASYATGFKAASVNLSRDSRPLASDAAALATAGLTKVNQSYGTRFADPEDSTVYEVGLKGSWDRVSGALASSSRRSRASSRTSSPAPASRSRMRASSRPSASNSKASRSS